MNSLGDSYISFLEISEEKRDWNHGLYIPEAMCKTSSTLNTHIQIF